MPKLTDNYQIYITKNVLDEAVIAADGLYPREVMLYLGGNSKKGKIIIDKIYYQHFVSNNVEAVSVLPLAANTFDSIGSFHSHPQGAAIPSEADLLVFTNIPVNLIFSYEESAIFAYDQDGNNIKFDVIEDKDISKLINKKKKVGFFKRMIKNLS